MCNVNLVDDDQMCSILLIELNAIKFIFYKFLFLFPFFIIFPFCEPYIILLPCFFAWLYPFFFWFVHFKCDLVFLFSFFCVDRITNFKLGYLYTNKLWWSHINVGLNILFGHLTFEKFLFKWIICWS